MNRLARVSLIMALLTMSLSCQKSAVTPGSGLTEEQVKNLEAASVLAAAVPYPKLEEVRRGCPACHTLVDKETGKYTLPYEALEATATHPKIFQATDDVSVKICLGCHAAGTGDREARGVDAPLAMRDITHPSHMSSQVFKLHYGGSCFTCHNVNARSEFELLTQKVNVDSKGVPNPEQIPIPGATGTDSQTP